MYDSWYGLIYGLVVSNRCMDLVSVYEHVTVCKIYLYLLYEIRCIYYVRMNCMNVVAM